MDRPDRAQAPVDFRTDPSRYRHWTLAVDGRVATLAMDVREDGGIRPGYELKLNSYDLGVDIELHDAVQRLRFEHPAVGAVIVTSGKERVFCAGANIRMLGQSSHGWKVNFCRFTNETRNAIEEATAESGQAWICAVNGPCAGGGYELALACDEILLVEDGNSTVSLPEVPLLGVLPGTGGLTRITDKRKVRHDLADIFCTTSEGVRGPRAKDWRLVDEVVKPQQFADSVKKRALELAASSDRPQDGQGVKLAPLVRTIDDKGYHYEFVDVQVDKAGRVATLTVAAPASAQPADAAGIVALGAKWWPLQMARELDDAILHLRLNEPEIGLVLVRTSGDPKAVLAADAHSSEDGVALSVFRVEPIAGGEVDWHRVVRRVREQDLATEIESSLLARDVRVMVSPPDLPSWWRVGEAVVWSLDAPMSPLPNAALDRADGVLTGCKVEPSLKQAAPGDRFQFERTGYFCVDPDSKDGRPVFNRTVTLVDSWAKIEKQEKSKA